MDSAPVDRSSNVAKRLVAKVDDAELVDRASTGHWSCMFDRLRHLFHFFAYSISAIGPRRLAGGSLRLLADHDARSHDEAFDTRFGTDTTTGLTPLEADLPVARRSAATMYLPTHCEDFAAMLSALAWPQPLLAQTTFIDVGSGKGRVVLLAAMQTFREAVGVELSPILHDLAMRNHAVVDRAGVLRSTVRFELGDAAQLEVPDGPVVVYLYHPFREPIFEAVIERLLASLHCDPRPIAILYGHPTLQRPIASTVFTRGGIFEQRATGERVTKRFRIGWSIFTNAAWLERDSVTVPRVHSALPEDQASSSPR
jgi:hypothetical protein